MSSTEGKLMILPLHAASSPNCRRHHPKTFFYGDSTPQTDEKKWITAAPKQVKSFPMKPTTTCNNLQDPFSRGNFVEDSFPIWKEKLVTLRCPCNR
jgi:hypothetical protein